MPETPKALLTLFDISDRVQIELRGGDRLAFLHNFCTNDIKVLKPGQGCEAFLTDIKGRILGHVIVSAADDALWLDSVPGSNETVVPHLDKYLIVEDAEIIDRSDDRGPVLLAETESAAWLQEHAGAGKLPMCGQQPATIGGVEVLVRRVPFIGPNGYELVVSHKERQELIETITSAGAAMGDADQFESLRVAAGFPHYGTDITAENIAQEAARNEEAISFTKGCYLGQEPIARLDALGHTNKELRRLVIDAAQPPQAGATVLAPDGSDAGTITSAAASPDASGVVALAMLKSAATAPETRLQIVCSDGASLSAVVAS